MTDSGGLNASDQIRVYVDSMPWPGMAEAGPNQTVSVGEEVTFNGSASVAYVQIASYTWTVFDDGPTDLDGVMVNYTFHKPGTYTVILTIKDESMSPLSTDSLTVVVVGSASTTPKADAGPDETIETGTNYRFNGSGTDGNIRELGFVWHFRYNGTWEFLIGEKPSFLFSNVGKYVVTLTVTDDEMRSDNDTVTITVLEREGSGGSVPSYLIWLVIVSSEGALIAFAAFIYARKVRRKQD